MVTEDNNPMSGDYRPYGINSPTNREIWNHHADQQFGSQQSGGFTAPWWWRAIRSLSEKQSAAETPGTHSKPGQAFGRSVGCMVLGAIGLAFAKQSLQGDAEMMVGVVSVGLIIWGILGLAEQLLRLLFRTLAPLMPMIIGVAIVFGLIYLVSGGK